MPLTDPSQDLALLREMRNGNAAAFEQLYRRHHAPLYRFALLRCSSRDTADDVVQEIFMGLFTNSFNFDPTRGALQSFLFGVARNLAMKRDEAQHRLVSTSRHDEDGEESNGNDLLVDASPDAETQLLTNQRADTVRRALARLAPHYRDVVILYEMHDLSYIEIAEICHIDIGTVRSRLSRARAQLAALLQEFAAPADTAASVTAAQHY